MGKNSEEDVSFLNKTYYVKLKDDKSGYVLENGLKRFVR